jgi:hypothetical protein
LLRWFITASLITITICAPAFSKAAPPGFFRLKDRIDRDGSIYMTNTDKERSLNDYFSSGQILLGCDGNESILPYVLQQVGYECFFTRRIFS